MISEAAGRAGCFAAKADIQKFTRMRDIQSYDRVQSAMRLAIKRWRQQTICVLP